ncbi:TadE/TadG family type IV pilus assembly protein [Pseudotabrizicola alkalilacus]|uniref:TadE/TadG family protein n=1 Tax=Pseudotabrizicola alkalilacus TaxID=2305252 RepID=A0A411Z0K9_9RHOB|nr:TadE/TadG family type IV pilus assembly protein [Pseudotabrizicola alkalilacus]RGP36587.1 TadE/TadG family protein [Pseudotabrizicola alkalilacus]
MDRRIISAAKRLSRKSALRFARDEDGHIVVFTAIMATLMLMLAGVGIDIINFETVRTKQQQTLDRATLAAASLTQELDAESVVRDYFAKADMADHLRLVQFQRTFNASTVRAEAEIELTPIFMNLYDLSDSTKLVARGASQAEQRINNIEIMLVLDVSGSMAGTKLTNLKSAASEFIDTVMSQDIENRVSIGIVPYNGQVNLPQYLQSMFNAEDDHEVDFVNCFDLPATTYNSLTLSRTTPMPVTAHADTYSTTSTGYIAPTHSNAVVATGNRWCPPATGHLTGNVIRAPTNNRTALKAHINGLSAIGATSINAGLKWGAALLDPSARSLYTGMVAQGQTPSYFGNRPFEYNDREAMKIIVLMTDGEHFAEERVNEAYRHGTSPIWRANSVNQYSIFHQARVNTSSSTNICNSRPFYVPHLNAWHSRPWNGSNPSSSTCYSTTATYTGATRQDWQTLWANVRLSWVAQQFYVRPLGVTQTNQMNAMRSQTPINTMNTQLQQVCGLAKAREVMIYGIAFEAPTNGRALIENCASSPAHYFNAQGLEISTAFRSIATNISQLKLTQ